MNISINNYRKYISGKLFAICGIIVILASLRLAYDEWFVPFDDEDIDIALACLDILNIKLSLYAPPICLFLSLLEFLIRKHFNFSVKAVPFKNQSKLDKFLTTILWTSIIFILIQFFMILRIIIIEHFLY